MSELFTDKKKCNRQSSNTRYMPKWFRPRVKPVICTSGEMISDVVGICTMLKWITAVLYTLPNAACPSPCLSVRHISLNIFISSAAFHLVDHNYL